MVLPPLYPSFSAFSESAEVHASLRRCCVCPSSAVVTCPSPADSNTILLLKKKEGIHDCSYLAFHFDSRSCSVLGHLGGSPAVTADSMQEGLILFCLTRSMSVGRSLVLFSLVQASTGSHKSTLVVVSLCENFGVCWYAVCCPPSPDIVAKSAVFMRRRLSLGGSQQQPPNKCFGDRDYPSFAESASLFPNRTHKPHLSEMLTHMLLSTSISTRVQRAYARHCAALSASAKQLRSRSTTKILFCTKHHV